MQSCSKLGNGLETQSLKVWPYQTLWFANFCVICRCNKQSSQTYRPFKLAKSANFGGLIRYLQPLVCCNEIGLSIPKKTNLQSANHGKLANFGMGSKCTFSKLWHAPNRSLPNFKLCKLPNSSLRYLANSCLCKLQTFQTHEAALVAANWELVGCLGA